MFIVFFFWNFVLSLNSYLRLLVFFPYPVQVFVFEFCHNCTFIYDLRAHYNVVLKEIEVGGDNLSLPSDVFDNGLRKGTIIDSGTTLAYLPQVVYGELMSKVNDSP